MQSTEECSVIECDREAQGRGMCLMHYKRGRTAARQAPDVFYGAFRDCVSVGPIPELRQDLGPCWEWNSAVNAAGYGVVAKPMFGTRLAHRVSKMLKLGRALDGDLMHHCDNPPCIRPSHLSESTHKENMADKAVKGRAVAPRAGQSECKNGHSLTELTAVKVVRKDGYVETKCLGCKLMNSKKQAAKRKAERHARGLKRKRTI